jgi:GNAT superfamily N-acetyltransferase
MTGAPAGPIGIVERSPVHPDAAAMLQAFYDEQVGRYGFAESVDLDPGQFAAPEGRFVVVYRDGAAAGCGSWRWHDPVAGTIEIKKTYLTPAIRGFGVGRTLLTWLERDAVAAGATQAILETGVRNTAALGLFTRQGYRPIASYVPGRPPEINRAFTRSLINAED